MKFNDIKFVPKANAVADAYAKATGVPFIGEMMVAAAGNTPTGSGDEGGGDDDQSHVYYVAYFGPSGSDDDYTESSGGTATMTDNVENGYREIVIDSNTEYPLENVHVWIDADAVPDDGEYWSVYTDSQGGHDIDMLDLDVKIYSTMPQ